LARELHKVFVIEKAASLVEIEIFSLKLKIITMNDILFITLWKRLIDENMMKRDLRLKAGLTTNVIAKMINNEI